MTTDHYRKLMKRRAELLEAATERDTQVIPQAKIEAAHAQAAGKCEFCPDGPGECAVCNVFDEVPA